MTAIEPSSQGQRFGWRGWDGRFGAGRSGGAHAEVVTVSEVLFPPSDRARSVRAAETLAASREAALVSQPTRDSAWRRPVPGDQPPGVTEPAAPVPAHESAASQATRRQPSPADGAPLPVTSSIEPDRGSPVPRQWLMVAAGSVMGAILAVGVYSVAVGGGGGNSNQFAFGQPAGGIGRAQGQ